MANDKRVAVFFDTREEYYDRFAAEFPSYECYSAQTLSEFYGIERDHGPINLLSIGVIEGETWDLVDYLLEYHHEKISKIIIHFRPLSENLKAKTRLVSRYHTQTRLLGVNYLVDNATCCRISS